MYELTFQQLKKMLLNFSAILDKTTQYADSKKIEADVLLQSRLAPDQFNFTRQVQIFCDTAKLGASRLTGKDCPSHPDSEKTAMELKARIHSTVAYLETFKAADFAGSPTIHVTQPRWEGKYINGEEYLHQHILPNFYFHMTTAYSILRHNGLDVGKKDYLGAMPFKH